jgi:hypothetical protein
MARKSKKAQTAAPAASWVNRVLESDLEQIEHNLPQIRTSLEDLPDDAAGDACTVPFNRLLGISSTLGTIVGRTRARGDLDPVAPGAPPADFGPYTKRVRDAQDQEGALANLFQRKCVRERG